jgi:hypothetical protein
MKGPTKGRGARVLSVLRYTFWRLLVFAGCLGVLYLVGLRRWALVLVALLISMPVAYVLLRRQTNDFATNLRAVLAPSAGRAGQVAGCPQGRGRAGCTDREAVPKHRKFLAGRSGIGQRVNLAFILDRPVLLIGISVSLCCMQAYVPSSSWG